MGLCKVYFHRKNKKWFWVMKPENLGGLDYVNIYEYALILCGNIYA